MTKYLLSLLFIASFSLNSIAQSQICKINGQMNDPSIFRYACLYISKTKKLTITPIVGTRFNFELNKQQDDVLGVLFLGLDSAQTAADVRQNGISGYRTSRMIALENMDICIDDDLNKAMIYGGQLNKDLDQMNSCSRSLDFKPFFEQHPDSPIAMIFLKSLAAISKKPMFASYIDCKSYFNDLSDRLKNSTEGKEVWARIND